MAPKKIPASAAKEPAAKRARVDEAGADDRVDDLSGEKPDSKELEVDAKKDDRPRIKDPITFEAGESTLNVIPTAGGRLLMSIRDGGMQYLIAGARANVGVNSGRYFFEVKIVDSLHSNEKWQYGKQMPRQLVRIGFSERSASLLLNERDPDTFFFDIEAGHFLAGTEKKLGGIQRCPRDVVVGILLNLEATGPNSNTVSLFKNGVRCSEPFPIPEGCKGKTLFPHIAFRSVLLQVNFGPNPLKALPFKCRMLQDASQSDVQVSKPIAPKGGKHEVIFPIGIPDEGTFDWLDAFLEKNPNYVELSDRMIVEWATKSGFWRKEGNKSNDKPEAAFGIPAMDDTSTHEIMSTIASVVPRDYVVMEVKQNLCPEERKQNLKMFPSFLFKKVAKVVMGQPSVEFRKVVKDKLLKEKVHKAEVAWKARKAERERKRMFEQRKKDIADKQKKAQDEAKKQEEKNNEDGTVEEEKTGEATENAAEEKAEMPVEEDALEENEPPEVSLTEEEEAMKFLKGSVPDVSPLVLDKCFGSFALPDKGEGFEEVQYEWDDAATSSDYLRQWVLDKKRTSRIEDLQPGEWFKAKQTEYTKSLLSWKAKQSEAKRKLGVNKKTEEEEQITSNLDVLAVEDINDIGKGEPLFLNFAAEDWALLALRWSMYSLAVAYKKDVNDPDRTEIPEAHIPFYYNKYFRIQLHPKLYGKDTFPEVLKIVKDTVALSESGNLTTVLDEEPTASFDTFVKLTEQTRRERHRRLDAGDETARLHLAPLVLGVGLKAKQPGMLF
eukprot:TRINITY_DN72025_c0_g1_i1.p1 TRINITY_DN72025_c0_g1~~TRINITY_DN72025_c0_g1_i1.p1  ORF type:complete len:777 (-),score=153.20 TRINITY_DN72025_c0_g1_i1:94-2424(-)